jgi:hypothetical protein
MDSLGNHHTDRDPRGARYPSAENHNGGWNHGDHRNIPDDQLPNRSYRNSAISLSICRINLVHYAVLLQLLLFMVRRLRRGLLWSVALRLQLLALL